MLKQIFFDLDVSVKSINIGPFKEKNFNTIQFVMNITDRGKTIDLSSVLYAQVTIKRPDGTNSNSLAVLDDHRVIYLLEPNALTQLGLHEAEVQLYGGDNKLMISSTFHYSVCESLYDESGITEQEEYPILVQLITQVENQMRLIEEYLNHKFLAIRKLDFYSNGYVAEYVDNSIKKWTYSVDDKGHIVELFNETDSKRVSINWHNTEH